MPPTRDAAGRFVGGGGARIDPAAVAEFIRSPDGPFFKYMVMKGEMVKTEARRLVGVHRPQPGERRSRRPGTLRDSIVKRVVVEGNMIVCYVGSSDVIALIHHEGTQPHTIVPRRSTVLVFWSARAGRVLYVRRVNHPGTKPNRYLVDALRVLG